MIGLLKFFGSLAIMDSPQQVCEKYPVFLEVVFSKAMNLDPTLTPVALDTLGVLGSTVEGKQVLQKTGSCVWERICTIYHSKRSLFMFQICF